MTVAPPSKTAKTVLASCTLLPKSDNFKKSGLPLIAEPGE